MSAKYWVAKYVDDPFKNETRNVGVVVQMNDIFAAKFFGERPDGSWDARIIKGLSHPSVYTQWKDYWRRKLVRKDIDAILQSATANYAVVSGGEVTDTGSDNVGEVCHFLYGLIVGRGPKEAFDWDEDSAEMGLADEIYDAFDKSAILFRQNQLFARHPVMTNSTIIGAKVKHKPSFTQLNGHLTVMEHIDLGASKINKTKERAGYIAYMFGDIKEAATTAETVSLVRPEGPHRAEQIDYAKTVLASGSKIINWADDNERNKFLQERKVIAEPALGFNVIGGGNGGLLGGGGGLLPPPITR